MFKLLKAIKPDFPNGPWYFFHNSWRLRSTYARAGRISRLWHVNNAISYEPPAGAALDPDWLNRPFFGLRDYSHAKPDYQDRERFTTAWGELEIRFSGDVIHHREVPDALHRAGYPAERFQVRGHEPFHSTAPGEAGLLPGPACRGTAEAFSVTLPDGRTLSRPGGGDVGAFQGEALFNWPELEAAAPFLDDAPLVA